MQEVTETFNRLAESTSLVVSSRNNSVRRFHVSHSRCPSWEKDFQHVIFQGQGQDTGTGSASVSIERLTTLSTPEFVLLIGM